ncbi:MAG: type II toxin-antitoxin system RelE/ParE family toxin [Luteibaculum sp.]
MKYRISKQAGFDLEHIWYYTYRKWSKEQADHHYHLILSEIDFIANNFHLGKSIEGTRKNYRYTPVKSHLIFYRRSDDQVVEIIRILHKGMEIKKHIE